jgi:hypothetical protein
VSLVGLRWLAAPWVRDYWFDVNTTGRITVLFCVATMFAASAYAGRVVSQDSPQAETNEALVFVTGSRIPQRIKVLVSAWPPTRLFALSIERKLTGPDD